MTGLRPWWEDVMRGKQNGFWAESLRSLARLGSMGYAIGVRSHAMAYGQGWLKTRRLPKPTVCVGNITAGGTGKTPLVIRVCEDLLKRGLKPAVLLRGYGRERSSTKPILVRTPNRIEAGLAESGDEAMELAHRLPGVVIGVGANRFAVGSFLLKRHPIDCLVLDDGFQHHALARDINLVTLDATDPWGGGRLLPAGLLREPLSALRRADAVILTRTGQVGPDRLSTLRQEVGAHLMPGSALLESHHVPVDAMAVATGEAVSLKVLNGRPVLVVSGIGNPAAFEATVAALGARITNRLRRPDHSRAARDVWRWIERHWRPGLFLVMTEKDARRWWPAPPGVRALSQTFAIRMSLVITRGKDHWDRFLDVVQTLAHAG